MLLMTLVFMVYNQISRLENIKLTNNCDDAVNHKDPKEQTAKTKKMESRVTLCNTRVTLRTPTPPRIWYGHEKSIGNEKV